jgi:hypothetical protein
MGSIARNDNEATTMCSLLRQVLCFLYEGTSGIHNHDSSRLDLIIDSRRRTMRPNHQEITLLERVQRIHRLYTKFGEFLHNLSVVD